MRFQCASLLLLLTAVAGIAQTNSGTITGTVSDSNSTLASFPVQVTNSETGITYSATTSADGGYTIPGLVPGQYRLLASKPPGPGGYVLRLPPNCGDCG